MIAFYSSFLTLANKKFKSRPLVQIPRAPTIRVLGQSIHTKLWTQLGSPLVDGGNLISLVGL